MALGVAAHKDDNARRKRLNKDRRRGARDPVKCTARGGIPRESHQREEEGKATSRGVNSNKELEADIPFHGKDSMDDVNAKEIDKRRKAPHLWITSVVILWKPTTLCGCAESSSNLRSSKIQLIASKRRTTHYISSLAWASVAIVCQEAADVSQRLCLS